MNIQQKLITLMFLGFFYLYYWLSIQITQRIQSSSYLLSTLIFHKRFFILSTIFSKTIDRLNKQYKFKNQIYHEKNIMIQLIQIQKHLDGQIYNFNNQFSDYIQEFKGQNLSPQVNSRQKQTFQG
ncbi:hypothetical protein pb186bvf_007696 [Paramecium bursaria]